MGDYNVVWEINEYVSRLGIPLPWPGRDNTQHKQTSKFSIGDDATNNLRTVPAIFAMAGTVLK